MADPGASEKPTEEQEREERERKAKEVAEQAALPYQWTQTIEDADVTVPIESTIKGKDLDIVITKTKIKVGLKGQEPIFEVSG